MGVHVTFWIVLIKQIMYKAVGLICYFVLFFVFFDFLFGCCKRHENVLVSVTHSAFYRWTLPFYCFPVVFTLMFANNYIFFAISVVNHDVNVM